ncbi:hypothetical protein BX600DRAFT_191628 [Xylariales sp. PMI_506]|nr:hypothetical protein BX600DRAFT_191628 [Xylariales sp. PMI_506]
MSYSLICSSMRRRPDWASLVPALLQGGSKISVGKWKETTLEHHDIAIPMPLIGQFPRFTLRAICLSIQDVGTEKANARTERLFNLNGGQYVAILLLMQQHGRGTGMAGLMRLQLQNDLELPIIPIASLTAAPGALQGFHQQLCTTAVSHNRPAPARSLLLYCSDDQVLKEHTINILSDITSDFKDLIAKATSSDGQKVLEEYLGPDAERVVNYWKTDYVID